MARITVPYHVWRDGLREVCGVDLEGSIVQEEILVGSFVYALTCQN